MCKHIELLDAITDLTSNAAQMFFGLNLLFNGIVSDALDEPLTYLASASVSPKRN